MRKRCRSVSEMLQARVPRDAFILACIPFLRPRCPCYVGAYIINPEKSYKVKMDRAQLRGCCFGFQGTGCQKALRRKDRELPGFGWGYKTERQTKNRLEMFFYSSTPERRSPPLCEIVERLSSQSLQFSPCGDQAGTSDECCRGGSGDAPRVPEHQQRSMSCIGT